MKNDSHGELSKMTDTKPEPHAGEIEAMKIVAFLREFADHATSIVTSDRVTAREAADLIERLARAALQSAARVDGRDELEQKLKLFQQAEHELSNAYLRLRSMIPGAYDTPHAPTSQQVWETTENALKRALATPDARAAALEEAAKDEAYASALKCACEVMLGHIRREGDLTFKPLKLRIAVDDALQHAVGILSLRALSPLPAAKEK